jgi:peptide/nickel transport system ATP-binding protein
VGGISVVEPVVEVKNLSVSFEGSGRTVPVVRDLSFSLRAGKVMTILGESGSGKSVTLNALLRLLPERKTRISGSVRVAGREVYALSRREIMSYRGAVASMIFQEPALAFDPMFTIGKQIVEAIRAHEAVSIVDARKRALELLDLVKIPSAATRLDNYPHEISGGMRQRAMIALALSCRPKLLLADEPTTALDATVQIQILLLLREIQRELGMAILFVTHDIGVAVEISDYVGVMYAGRLVEQGDLSAVIKAPRHPYTQALLSSTIQGSQRGRRLSAIAGSPPDPALLPTGCAFAPRCMKASPECGRILPQLTSDRDGRTVACLHA